MTEKIRPPTKRQHYLPVVYLKHFAAGEGAPTRTSRIWRFDGIRSIHVPAESQCFQRYFYSVKRANEAEQMFGSLESEYGKCMHKISEKLQSSQRNYIALILVMFDLHLRNNIYENLTGKEELDAYFARLSWLRREIAGRQEIVPTDAEVLASLKAHWRVRIIKVAADHQFITSDNPSMWFSLGREDHPLGCVILPVSPFSLAISFDSRYAGAIGSQAEPRDVKLLNRNQCYRAHRSIFSAQELDMEERKSVAKALTYRPEGRPKTEAIRGDIDTVLLKDGMLTFLQVKG